MEKDGSSCAETVSYRRFQRFFRQGLVYVGSLKSWSGGEQEKDKAY